MSNIRINEYSYLFHFFLAAAGCARITQSTEDETKEEENSRKEENNSSSCDALRVLSIQTDSIVPFNADYAVETSDKTGREIR